MNLKGYALGIDLGGTKIAMGVVDSTGNILDEITFPTDALLHSETVINHIIEMSGPLIKKYSNIVSLGIGVAGQINKGGNEILFAPNLHWKNVAIKQILEKNLGLPSILLNDVRAATWGEWLHGAGKGCNDFICLFIGTGFGGGIVSGGHLINGYSNSAGEIGHTTIQENGRLCSCGNKGCLEAYVSGWAIASILKETLIKYPEKKSALLTLVKENADHIKAEYLGEGIVKNDPLALEIYNSLTLTLAHGCVSLINMLNPQRLIFGGSVALGLPNLLKNIEMEIKKCALGAATKELEIVPALLGKNSVVIGAACAALSIFQIK